MRSLHNLCRNNDNECVVIDYKLLIFIFNLEVETHAHCATNIFNNNINELVVMVLNLRVIQDSMVN